MRIINQGKPNFTAAGTWICGNCNCKWELGAGDVCMATYRRAATQRDENAFVMPCPNCGREVVRNEPAADGTAQWNR